MTYQAPPQTTYYGEGCFQCGGKDHFARDCGKKVKPTSTLFINNLPDEYTGEALEAIFSSLEGFESCRVRKDRNYNKCGFVEFSEPRHAEKAKRVGEEQRLSIQYSTTKKRKREAGADHQARGMVPMPYRDGPPMAPPPMGHMGAPMSGPPPMGRYEANYEFAGRSAGPFHQGLVGLTTPLLPQPHPHVPDPRDPFARGAPPYPIGYDSRQVPMPGGPMPGGPMPGGPMPGGPMPGGPMPGGPMPGGPMPGGPMPGPMAGGPMPGPMPGGPMPGGPMPGSHMPGPPIPGPPMHMPMEGTTLYVEGVPTDATEREISHIFRPFVGFLSLRLLPRKAEAEHVPDRMLCFVEFRTREEADVAQRTVDGYFLDPTEGDGPRLRVTYAQTKRRMRDDRDRPEHDGTPEVEPVDERSRSNGSLPPRSQ